MSPSRLARIEIALQWQSPYADHRDRYYFDTANFQCDCFPAELGVQLQQLSAGESATVDILFDDWQEAYEKSLVKSIRRDQFRRRSKHPLPQVTPRTGRFYPRNFVSSVAEINSSDPRPIRCLEAGEEKLVIDLNHPLAGRRLQMQATLLGELESHSEPSGVTNYTLHISGSNGPGMQASLPDVDTDFFTEHAFDRIDNNPDSEFYAPPRLVQHLDSTCRQHITELYACFVQPGMRLLDLMSSWVSHLPQGMIELDVHGLGMNAEELKANSLLSGYSLQDLNQTVELPFDEASFDMAVCSASIEYLTRPVEVMQQIARVLKPGAPFVVTFSDRWFPTKAIQLWSELHPFERVGLVIDYFRHSGAFKDIGTESLRGYPRPEDDPHIDQLSHSDPVFAVWGYRQ